MRRKTFVKQLMALGFQRNEANKLCREAVAIRDQRNASGGKYRLAFGYSLAMIYLGCSFDRHINCRQLTEDERQKFYTWYKKRTKAEPISAWQKTHPNEI